jgi:hypothetical protein
VELVVRVTPVVMVALLEAAERVAKAAQKPSS